MSVLWTPLWVVKDDYWRSLGLCILEPLNDLAYIFPIVDHTFVWGGREGVKCHLKILSFVRNVRTFEMTPYNDYDSDKVIDSAHRDP